MTALCQFCRQIIVGPEPAAPPSDRRTEWEYRQLSLLISFHMMDDHEEEAGQEITAASALAGAAIAMRYVTSSDPSLDTARRKAGEALMETFQPAPHAPLPSLSDQAADASGSSASASPASAL
jgi:hypothetical protein